MDIWVVFTFWQLCKIPWRRERLPTPVFWPGDERDVGSIPGWGRFPGVGNGNPLWYSCLENSMGRGAWWATVHDVAKSWTWKHLSTHRAIMNTNPCLNSCFWLFPWRVFQYFEYVVPLFCGRYGFWWKISFTIIVDTLFTMSPFCPAASNILCDFW